MSELPDRPTDATAYTVNIVVPNDPWWAHEVETLTDYNAGWVVCEIDNCTRDECQIVKLVLRRVK